MVAGCWLRLHSIAMFIGTEADAAAIRTIFQQRGELSAAIEPRRRVPDITDNR
jgi:hypothetical protein